MVVGVVGVFADTDEDGGRAVVVFCWRACLFACVRSVKTPSSSFINRHHREH